MRYIPLMERVGNAVRFTEVLQVLISNGFAHILRASGLLDGLPTRLLQELNLLEKSPEGRMREPETVGRRLRRVLTELGPTFVKLGQVLSTRPDLLDEEICQELTQLQDRVAVTPFARMEEVLRGSLGAGADELFEEFDTEPVAAASISQVYRARLPSGEAVAVKIQRPGLEATIESDLRLLRALAEWVSSHWQSMNWTDPSGTVEEFARSIRRELDFHQERRILERFRDNFAEEEHVVVPRVFPGTSARQVLTMEWIDGIRLDAVEGYPERSSDPTVVARLGVAVVCRQVFEHRFFHADPHPGNIVLTQRNHVAFLDYGMVGHLAQRDVEAMADLLRAVMEQDAEACVRVLQLFTTKGYAEDPRALQHEVADLLAFEAQAIVDEGRVGAAIEALTAVLRRHHLELAPRFTLLLKALATIETTARKLDPELEIVPILRPYVQELVVARYRPANLAARAEEELLHALRVLRTMPDDLQAITGQVRQGRMRLAMHHEGLQELGSTLDRAASHLSFAIVIGALILGSSWLLATNVVAQKIGVFGYVGAAVLGIYLAVSAMRRSLG